MPNWCNWSAWYYYNDSTATCGIPLNYKKPGTTREGNAGDYAYNYSFMSRHRGGGNFCMCDGSVTFIAEEIEYLGTLDPNGTVTIGSTKYSAGVYMALATIDGSEFIDRRKMVP